MEGSALFVTPFLDDKPHGIFATRSPKRPNPIGLSTVRLVGIRANVLDIEDLDILDGTPLLDTKPYMPADERDSVWPAVESSVGRFPSRIGSADRLNAGFTAASRRPR
jgi:tRNA (Thr-GGU) A37 N-methylase